MVYMYRGDLDVLAGGVVIHIAAQPLQPLSLVWEPLGCHVRLCGALVNPPGGDGHQVQPPLMRLLTLLQAESEDITGTPIIDRYRTPTRAHLVGVCPLELFIFLAPPTR